jgi:hypothetical protein
MAGIRSPGIDYKYVSTNNKRPTGNNSMLSEMADAIENDYKPLCITQINLSQTKLKKSKDLDSS